jgi:hypothetical protein
MSAPTLLLQGSDTRNRIRQQAVPIMGAAGLIAGLALLAVRGESARLSGGIMVGAGVALLLAAPQLLVAWDVEYKGHAIRFENSVLFGERLYIDEERFSSGPFGYQKVLEGTITTGQGAGDRIRSESTAGLFRFDCRITAEASGASGEARQEG